MIEKHEDGAVTVTLGFEPYQPPKDPNYDLAVICAPEYIARAVGVLADAKIKENLP